MGHLNLCPVQSLMKGRFCFCRSTYMWNKEKKPQSAGMPSTFTGFPKKKKKKKHCYPVITRHKEVTAIAVGVKFTDRCAYCKSRPDYLVLMTKHKKKKPKTSNDITFISMKWSISLPGIPQSLKACFHRERQVLVRGQGGSVGCIELAHS